MRRIDQWKFAFGVTLMFAMVFIFIFTEKHVTTFQAAVSYVAAATGLRK